MKRLAFVLFALSMFPACGHAPPAKDVIWPLPPDKPRIKYVTTFAATSDLDRTRGYRFKKSLFGLKEVVIKQPMGIAISDDGQRVYVADYLNSHILVADMAAKRVKMFAPDEPMGHMFNVALDAQENVYGTDSQNKQVLVYDKDGKALRAFGQKEKIERPTGLAIDRVRGLVYVVDGSRQDSGNHRVLVYSLEGKYLRELGPKVGKPGRGADDGNFYFPTFITVDQKGYVYVADTLNFRIQVFSPNDGKFVRKFGVQGDGPGTFNKLKGLAIDGFGILYAVDSGHGVVQLFNEEFQLLTDFGGLVDKLEYFDIPGAIAIEPRTNRIYVANEYIARINVYQLFNTTAADLHAKPPESKPADGKSPAAKPAGDAAKPAADASKPSADASK